MKDKNINKKLKFLNHLDQKQFEKDVMKAIEELEDDTNSIIDYEDQSVTVNIKMHGISHSCSISTYEANIYKLAEMFNNVLVGAGFNQETIDLVLKG